MSRRAEILVGVVITFSLLCYALLVLGSPSLKPVPTPTPRATEHRPDLLHALQTRVALISPTIVPLPPSPTMVPASPSPLARSVTPLPPTPTPLPNPASSLVLFEDDFSKDTLATYEVFGTVAVYASGRWLVLGDRRESTTSAIYTRTSFGGDFAVSARLYMPTNAIGIHDSVALALYNSSTGTTCWAVLAYGTSLVERNHVSIMRNDRWGDLYPMQFVPGVWYRVKVELRGAQMRMKAWQEGTVEPDWQVSRTVERVPAGPWAVGFRQAGRSTLVDDLTVLDLSGSE